jgi:hypothetical protein
MAQPIYLDPELQGIERERQLAQALQQRGMKPVEGQMVSGRFVAPSWTQYLANAYDTYSGGQRMADVEKKSQSYADALRQQNLKDIQAYGQAMQGTPEQAVYGAGEEGPTKQITAPAVAPNPEKALGILMGSKSPQSQALAQALLADQIKSHILPEGGTLIRGSLGGAAGQTIQGAPKDPTEYKEYQKAKEGGYQGNFFDYQKDLKRAGAPSVSVNTEQTYGGTLAKGAAEQDLVLKSIADNASTVVSNAARQKQILNSGKVFAGKGANIQQELASYADAIGLGGKDTATKIANTQSAMSGLANVTLDSIKNSGLGSGQGFTDKDREFLQDAKSGRITWNKDSILRVYDLQERAAIQGAKRWNERYKQLPKSSTGPLGWGEVQVPTPYGQSDVRSEADKIIGDR